MRKMRIILVIWILIILFPVIVFCDGLTTEQIEATKKVIATSDKEAYRARMVGHLLRGTNGKEINFVLPYLENDPSVKVRAAIAAPESLGTYGDDSIAVPALLKAREDESLSVKLAVVKSLLNRGYEKEIKKPLIRLVQELYSRNQVMQTISILKDVELKNAIRKEVDTLIKNNDLPIINRAYYALILSYNFQVPVEENKALITKAIRDIPQSTDNKNRNTIHTIVSTLGTMAQKNINQKKSCLEILKEAERSANKEISDTAKTWIRNVGEKK